MLWKLLSDTQLQPGTSVRGNLACQTLQNKGKICSVMKQLQPNYISECIWNYYLHFLPLITVFYHTSHPVSPSGFPKVNTNILNKFIVNIELMFWQKIQHDNSSVNVHIRI